LDVITDFPIAHGDASIDADGMLMISTNFEFLRDASPLFVETAAFAEKYCYSDPYGAAVKLRVFTEALVEDMYHRLRFPRPYNANLNDLRLESAFVRSTPRVIRDHFDLLRKLGNNVSNNCCRRENLRHQAPRPTA
jgi:hypothetical protein